MDDDWDDEPASVKYAPHSNEVEESGHHLGKGRGFLSTSDDDFKNDFSMDRNNSYGNRDRRGGYGGGQNFDRNGDNGGRRFGSGRTRGRGEDGERNYDRGGRGFGGNNRGSENGRGDFHSNENGQSGETEKPKAPPYIPPEPTNDEETMFGRGISSGINFSKYDSIKVKVTGENVPNSINSFEDSGMRAYVINNIIKSGYNKPTPVQKWSLPIILSGRDLMACAQTGSGKTAAFLLPIINQLLEVPHDLVYNGSCTEPQAVILSPTRELTLQIYNEALKFSYTSILRSVVAYGGTSVMHQANKLQNGCHILVATPGRLNDYVQRGRISFNSVRFFVLDEADRMLDMGFLPEIEKMLNHPSMVPTGERQTLMFSATFPEDIQRLAFKFLHDYLFLTVGMVGGACSDVEQLIYKVTKFEKREKLGDLIKEENCDRTLVFVETKRTADFLAVFLSERQFRTTSIHGDRLQKEREEALADFKAGRSGVLVATAVAARGLDIKGVNHVINYDLPKSIEEYVHRIGRTGRVGNRGKATSFYDPDHDGQLAQGLVKILQQTEQEVPDWLMNGEGSGYGGFAPRSFGGSDVRKFNHNNDVGTQGNVAQPQIVGEEEQW